MTGNSIERGGLTPKESGSNPTEAIDPTLEGLSFPEKALAPAYDDDNFRASHAQKLLDWKYRRDRGDGDISKEAVARVQEDIWENVIIPLREQFERGEIAMSDKAIMEALGWWRALRDVENGALQKTTEEV